jgi:hypothetical protein
VDAQERLDLAEQLPPGPLVQVDEHLGVLLDGADGLLLAVRAPVPLARQVALRRRLEARQQRGNLPRPVRAMQHMCRTCQWL